METGIILKALSGFYYVAHQGRLLPCRARGKFRHAGLTPLVGDRVEYLPLEDGSGMIDAILPRQNQFQRPAVANHRPYGGGRLRRHSGDRSVSD